MGCSVVDNIQPTHTELLKFNSKNDNWCIHQLVSEVIKWGLAVALVQLAHKRLTITLDKCSVRVYGQMATTEYSNYLDNTVILQYRHPVIA